MHLKEITMAVADFKAKCLQVMKDLEERRIEKVTVTRRGKPIARLTGVGEKLAPAFGSMRGTIHFAPNFDPSEPTCDELTDAEQGILHR